MFMGSFIYWNKFLFGNKTEQYFAVRILLDKKGFDEREFPL